MKITKERAQAARAMAHTRQQMAEILGVHIGSISRILKRYGLKPFRRPPIGEQEARAAREKAMSLNEMARLLSCCNLAARQAIKRYGLEGYNKKSYSLPPKKDPVKAGPKEEAPPLRRIPITDELREQYALKKKERDVHTALLRQRGRRNKLIFLVGLIVLTGVVLTGLFYYAKLISGG